MIYWIRRGARIFGGGVFFVVLISMLLRQNAFEIDNMITALVYAFFSGAACWFMGIVISDIVIKGVLTDVGDTGVTALLEGGLLQRVQTMQEELVPGGRELPFDEPGVPVKKGRGGNAKGKKKKQE